MKLVHFIFSFQFSKLLILFETAVVCFLTIKGIQLAELCIVNQFSGSLPWIATMVTAAWSAYGVSSAFYYNKGKAEQIAKIEKFGIETPIAGMESPIGLSEEDTPTI